MQIFQSVYSQIKGIQIFSIRKNRVATASQSTCHMTSKLCLLMMCIVGDFLQYNYFTNYFKSSPKIIQQAAFTFKYGIQQKVKRKVFFHVAYYSCLLQKKQFVCNKFTYLKDHFVRKIITCETPNFLHKRQENFLHFLTFTAAC